MTPPVAVPENVTTAVCRRWPDHGPQWAEDVEHELQDLCARYGAETAEVLPARYGFVVATVGRHGKLVMRASADPNGADQAAVAVTLADLDIGPQIHEVVPTDTGIWTVMDQIEPGCSFADLTPSQRILDSLANTLAPMLGRTNPRPDLPTLADWLHQRLVDDQLQDLPPGQEPAPPSYRVNALEVLADLTANNPAGLGHGDLSPGNVLYCADGRFFLIDPRGTTGEVSYDVAVLSSKAPQYGQPTAVASLLADALGLGRERIFSWLSVVAAARV